MEYEKIKQAYEEVLSVLNKYKDIINVDHKRIKHTSENHLFGVELKEKYGFNLDPKRIESLDWHKFNDYISIGFFGEARGRKISWSDNEKQPEQETLLNISFSTGPFIFGNDYPNEVFERFWQELKSYSPDYTDTANHCLYFKLNNGGKIFNEFDGILKKYYEINKAEFNQRKIKKLQDELSKLL